MPFLSDGRRRKAMIDDVIETLSYPSFNPAFVPVLVDENTGHLRAGAWDGPIKTLRDPEGDGDIQRLFDGLDGQTHVTELLDEFDQHNRSDVAELLLMLHDEAIIYDTQSRSSAWAHTALNPDMKAKESTAIRGESVFVVSNGSLGRQLAGDIVAQGLDDVVLASMQPADDTSRDRPQPTFSEVELTEAQLQSEIEDASFVVACSDRPHRDLFELVNQLAIETETPWTAGQILGRNGVVGPTVFPGETACYACFEQRLLSNVSTVEHCKQYLAAGSGQDRSTHVTPLERIVSGYLSLDLFNLLAYGSGYTAGRVLTIDSLTLSFSSEDVLRVPRCSACAATRTAGENTFLTVSDLADLIGNREGTDR